MRIANQKIILRAVFFIGVGNSLVASDIPFMKTSQLAFLTQPVIKAHHTPLGPDETSETLLHVLNFFLEGLIPKKIFHDDQGILERMRGKIFILEQCILRFSFCWADNEFFFLSRLSSIVGQTELKNRQMVQENEVLKEMHESYYQYCKAIILLQAWLAGFYKGHVENFSPKAGWIVLDGDGVRGTTFKDFIPNYHDFFTHLESSENDKMINCTELFVKNKYASLTLAALEEEACEVFDVISSFHGF